MSDEYKAIKPKKRVRGHLASLSRGSRIGHLCILLADDTFGSTSAETGGPTLDTTARCVTAPLLRRPPWRANETREGAWEEWSLPEEQASACCRVSAQPAIVFDADIR